jgi:heat-inducible transcriptional repressor
MSERKPTRTDKEKTVLMGLVELYIKLGKPIGSNTLKENGFDHLSSATIRNYFVKLEDEGYLVQHHASGGRVPTDLAFKLYALNVKDQKAISNEDQGFIDSILEKETKEVSAYLMKTIEALAEISSCSAILLAPRFDQDFIKQVRLLQIDPNRALCVISTDFGMIHTEVLFTPKSFNHEEIVMIEEYFSRRLLGETATLENVLLEQFAQRAYNEVVLRHVVHYTNFEQQDVYRTGFAKLLNYPEFQDVSLLASSLALFENTHILRSLLKECFHHQELKFWVGRDLSNYTLQQTSACVIAMPYMINQKVVGVIAILGPQRTDYKQNFGILSYVTKHLSTVLTQSLYHHKISYRQPETSALDLKKNKDFSYENTTRFLLETKTH